MKQKDIEGIVCELNDYFREQDMRLLIQAIEEAPIILVQILEEYCNRK